MARPAKPSTGSRLQWLVIVFRDPVAWILVIAGVVELISGGTAARGAILFAAAALILAERIRADRSPHATGSFSGAALQTALRPHWSVGVLVGAAMLVALLPVQSPPMTAIVGLAGVGLVGWAWLTHPGKAGEANPARKGLFVWGGVFLGLGLWELVALLGQPTLSEASYDHPTISFLAEPILATYPGRCAGLILWALAGRALVQRS